MAGAQCSGSDSVIRPRFLLVYIISFHKWTEAVTTSDQCPVPASAVGAVWVMVRVRNDLQTPRDNTICIQVFLGRKIRLGCHKILLKFKSFEINFNNPTIFFCCSISKLYAKILYFCISLLLHIIGSHDGKISFWEWVKMILIKDRNVVS